MHFLYPYLDEPNHFDIQSTEQKSHCVNIILWMRWIDERLTANAVVATVLTHWNLRGGR
jgi:hypothetical protein